eukprot:839682-Rhodomonas_salina.2
MVCLDAADTRQMISLCCMDVADAKHMGARVGRRSERRRLARTSSPWPSLPPTFSRSFSAPSSSLCDASLCDRDVMRWDAMLGLTSGMWCDALCGWRVWMRPVGSADLSCSWYWTLWCAVGAQIGSRVRYWFSRLWSGPDVGGVFGWVQVHLLQKEMGSKKHLRVAPLFETKVALSSHSPTLLIHQLLSFTLPTSELLSFTLPTARARLCHRCICLLLPQGLPSHVVVARCCFKRWLDITCSDVRNRRI